MLELLALKTAAVFCFVYFGWIYGEHLGHERSPLGRWFIGALTMVAIQSLWQTLFYYLNLQLGIFTDALSLVLTILSLGPLIIKSHVKEPSTIPREQPVWTWVSAVIIPTVLATLYIVRGAWLASTVNPILTPWPLLPTPTLGAFAIIGLAGILSAWKARAVWPTIIIASLGLISVISIAPIIYTNGFGFDGFLHRASMEIIASTGTLSPKPPYYIGLYVLETWLTRILAFPIREIDRWFMLVGMAFLPIGLAWTSRNRQQTNWMIATTLLITPLAPFITTTPQAFAYLIGFLAITASLGRLHPITTLTLAAWSLAIHPLAGLPFCLITLAILARKHLLLSAPLILAAGVSVPFAFAILGFFSSSSVVTFDLSKLLTTHYPLLTLLTPPTNRVALWADATVLFQTLQLPIIIIASLVAIWKNRERRREWILLSIAGVLLIAAGFFLQTAGDFAFLIEYERGNYADRLFIMAQLVLLLPGLTGIGIALSRIPRLALAPAIFILALIPAGISANVYAALPRYDAAVINHGWSAGQADQEAIRWIDRDASGSAYTALANQSVSAVAVQELGFKRYANDVFFYPIPTGGPLYKTFLEAMDINATIDPIRQAAKLGQTKLVYVVVNDYWWDAAKVMEHLSTLSNAQESFHNGSIRVYRFEIN